MQKQGLFFDMYFVYILHSPCANMYYVGHTNDPSRRTDQHLKNHSKTFTGKYSDWELKALFEAGHSRSVAMKVENFIKKQKSRTLIEKLVDPEFSPSGILAQLVRAPYVRD